MDIPPVPIVPSIHSKMQPIQVNVIIKDFEETYLFLCNSSQPIILDHMVKYSEDRLDKAFAVLSDSTRRGVLMQLGRGDTSITKLADQFHMSLAGMKKHVGILEEAGFVRTEKIGRVRTCKLGPHQLDSETAWIERYKELWNKRFDALEAVVQDLKQKREDK